MNTVSVKMNSSDETIESGLRSPGTTIEAAATMKKVCLEGYKDDSGESNSNFQLSYVKNNLHENAEHHGANWNFQGGNEAFFRIKKS